MRIISVFCVFIVAELKYPDKIYFSVIVYVNVLKIFSFVFNIVFKIKLVVLD